MFCLGKIFEIFDAKSRVWGQFGPENKRIEGHCRPIQYVSKNVPLLFSS